MPKSARGRGKVNNDSRRNGSRIAISPSSVAKVDAIAQVKSKSRADVLEELIELEFKSMFQFHLIDSGECLTAANPEEVVKIMRE